MNRLLALIALMLCAPAVQAQPSAASDGPSLQETLEWVNSMISCVPPSDQYRTDCNLRYASLETCEVTLRLENTRLNGERMWLDETTFSLVRATVHRTDMREPDAIPHVWIEPTRGAVRLRTMFNGRNTTQRYDEVLFTTQSRSRTDVDRMINAMRHAVSLCTPADIF
jgi:hypothetical protein